MSGLTSARMRLLRFWGANMAIAFSASNWWPGFSYTDTERTRLEALGATVPPAAIALWMLAFVPAIFILIAGLAVVGIMLPVLTLLYSNPADLQPLPFVLLLAIVAALTIGLALPLAMSLGGRLALRLAGEPSAPPEGAGDAALYAKFRRQLWRVVFVLCGLFVPGCWLWIVYDIQAGPTVTILKWVAVAIMLASGGGIWRLRRS